MAAPADDRGHQPAPGRNANRLLRIIALYKLAKALFFFLGALELLRLLSPVALDRTGAWVERLPFAPERRLGGWLLSAVAGKGPDRIRVASAAAAAYGILFTVEGIGLWLGRRWAEYLTVTATATGIPVELWELGHRPTLLAGMLLLLNILIVVYLVRRIRQPRPH
jgi:uncharacterized membrane protein (DUF2068 family)